MGNKASEVGLDTVGSDAAAERIREQAARVEMIIPRIARRLFTIDPEHPLAEMPIAQLRLCSLLLGQDGPTMSQVADEMCISVSAVTQLADRLERSGLVERVSSDQLHIDGSGDRDRRARHLRLTQHGRDLMLSRRALRQKSTRAALARMTPEQRELLLGNLEILLMASQSGGDLPAGTLPMRSDAETQENISHMEWRNRTAGS